MKTTKYSNYNSNQEVLTELLGQLMRSGGGGRSSNGYSSRRREGGRSSGRAQSRSRASAIRRSAARASSRLPSRGLTRSAKPRSPRRSNGTVGRSTNATTGQKRSATESGGPEKKKIATEGKGDGADKEANKKSQDNYTKGLSEIGLRWYNRYLKEGLEPKAASKKAWEHYTEPAEFEPQWGKELQIKEGEDDKAHFLSRVRRKKRPVINEDLRIAVHPKDFPDQMLDLPSVVALEGAIMAEVAKGESEQKLKFTYAHLRPGAVLVDCVDEATANWLKEIVNKLSTWEGPELTTSLERAIPDAYVMSIVLPKSVGQEFERTLALITAQNEDLNTEVWKLVNEREENGRQVVTIRVDKDSFNTIKRNDWKVYYRFEKVGVHFHRYLRYNSSPVLWITNPSCHKQNQVKPPGPTGTK